MAERLVVVGGDAGGMAAASQARRRRPDLEIVALERGRWTSYSACGIPYLVAGDVARLDDLVTRDPQTFRDRHNIDVRTGHEATAVDLDARRVEVRDHNHGRTFTLGFDHLHLATGATPVRPDLPGIDGPRIHGVQTLEDAAHLLEEAERCDAENVVVVGAGYIGLEMAEAFVRRGCPTVTVVEQGAEVMATLDPDMGAMVGEAMRQFGIVVRTGTSVTGFEPGSVHTEDGRLPADLVVLGLGVAPASGLAAGAGLETGVKEAVVVDPRQRTSTEGVWAAGDCCQSFHLVSRRPVHLPLGTVANKQGRVAGVNLGGGYATFPGVVGTAVTKVCSTEVARTGLDEREATAAGLGYETARIESSTRAGYFPGAGRITVKMVAERRTGRLLGAQIVGAEGAAKRIDVVATAVTAGLTVDQVVDLDLSYAPPFSPVWDPVLVAAREVAKVVR
ncbi:MAG TPA: FAD-dependent oxidoreductase [Acidimicrobiales bacterium]|jgi:NADPH-dependent 2,4-dienoyl-CoA reductase/sulfur reductase-like enzyme|nr:FAD-dependent oxidoreductase [Acidimicrobiales bacterium]